MADRKKPAKSDRPRQELRKERETFAQNFLKQGVKVSGNIAEEGRALHQHVVELETQNAQLRTQLASDDAIRELLKKIEALEAEKRDLLSRYDEEREVASRFLNQFTQVETELSNLANLYIASFQLHASLTLSRTVRQIKEVLEQLVGARAMAIYLVEDETKKLVPITSVGLGLSDLHPVDTMDGGVLGQVYITATPHIEAGPLAGGSRENPVAVVPLNAAGRVLGVLAVFSTFEQKPKFLPVDFELFKLLAEHAGRALVCARLFEDAEREIPDLEGYLAFDL